MSTFIRLAELGETLAATKKKLAHRTMISEYLKSLDIAEVPVAARLIIGRVFPESEPRILNMSGAAVSRVMEQIAGAPIDWQAIGGAVDFGEAVQKWLELRRHAAQGEPLQLMEVYAAYEAIAEDAGAGSRERKTQRIHSLFQRATPLEAKYLTKHLVKEMRVGVSELSLLDALAHATGIHASAIRRANQVSGDVGEVARVVLTEGEAGLSKLGARVGFALKPMLAQPADDVADAFARAAGPVALEYKLDGVRVQIHKRGNEVKLFSRNLSDITSSLPEIVEVVRNSVAANEAILDGEVIALNESGRPRPFQDVMRRVGRERDVVAFQSEVAVKLFVFDVLAADGQVLLDLPNSERWEILQRVKGSIESVQRMLPDGIADAEQFLKQVRDAGHEGLVAKLLTSPYAPGERGRYWFKIKPVVTLDLVIVAGEWGYGRRTGWLSNVHLAARDKDSGELLEVGKTFKGLTDEEFKALTERLLANKIRERGNAVWVTPNIVVEVAFNNVQRSPRYPSGVALRLARIINFRPDKSVNEIETIQYLRELMAAEQG